MSQTTNFVSLSTGAITSLVALSISWLANSVARVGWTNGIMSDCCRAIRSICLDVSIGTPLHKFAAFWLGCGISDIYSCRLHQDSSFCNDDWHIGWLCPVSRWPKSGKKSVELWLMKSCSCRLQVLCAVHIYLGSRSEVFVIERSVFEDIEPQNCFQSQH